VKRVEGQGYTGGNVLFLALISLLDIPERFSPSSQPPEDPRPELHCLSTDGVHRVHVPGVYLTYIPQGAPTGVYREGIYTTGCTYRGVQGVHRRVYLASLGYILASLGIS